MNTVTTILGYLLTIDIVSKQRRASNQQSSNLAALTSANIWLFPPLFFFSGLYYTDVQSAFWTLLAYRGYLKYEQNHFSSWADVVSQVIVGIISLFFRQTNIFWVAVFPTALALASSAIQQSTRTPGAFGGTRKSSPLAIITDSWNKSRLYDLPVHDAGIEGTYEHVIHEFVVMLTKMQDYALTAVSLAVVTIANLKRSLSIILPYIVLSFTFAAFVIWNGSVVLGTFTNQPYKSQRTDSDA